MDAERYGRIREWFDALRDLDSAERAKRLAEEQDPEVRARVEALLGRDTVGPAAVPKAVGGLLGVLAEEAPKAGDAIGAWTLMRVLGEGGMGTVFEARRSDGHFDQTAALKVLKGLPSATALSFLARERQILAGLSHPNIARLLDGGATPGGHPYFVMAMQEGMPIDQYVASRQLRATDIVRLLLPVCAAIGYAHSRLVIHCDLKPANILVDANGQPCVLDFGIARPLADAAKPAETDMQGVTARAYTPGFASPELEAGEGIGAAADLFSLGRMLAVLVGRDALQQHPDLDAIAAKASHPDPQRRYQSVAAFEADLQHWLGHRPVSARDGAVPYRTRLWLRRHWTGALVATLVLALILGFTLNTIRERDRALQAEQTAKAERDRALAAESRSKQISEFVVSMLDGANPDAGTGEVPVSKLVSEALKRIDTELDGQAEVQSELYGTLGRALRLLGNNTEAGAALEKAVALAREIDRPLVLAEQLTELARYRLAVVDSAAAEVPAREAWQIYHAQPDVALDVRMAAAMELAVILSNLGKPESTELLNHVLDTLRKEAPGSAQYTDALDMLAGNRIRFDRNAEAEALLRESLAIQIKQGRADDESSITTREILGRVLSDLNQPEEAEHMMRDALALRRSKMGEDDPHIPWRLVELARVLDNDGRSLEALGYYAEALKLAETKIGADTVTYAVMLNGQAMSLQRAGDVQAAERVFSEAVRIARKHWGDADQGTARLVGNAARLQLQLGKLDQAWHMASEAERIWAKQFPVDHSDVTETRATLARIACAAGRVAESRSMLQQIDAAVKEPPPGLRRLAERALACLAERSGDLDASLAHLLAAEAADRERFTSKNPQIWLGQLDRIQLLIRRNQPGDRVEARQLAETVLSNVDAALVPNAPQREVLKRLIGS